VAMSSTTVWRKAFAGAKDCCRNYERCQERSLTKSAPWACPVSERSVPTGSLCRSLIPWECTSIGHSGAL